jgi:hypothetical protein
LYGLLEISPGADDGNMTFVVGPGKFPGNLSHWTDNTWLLSFPDPNELVTFSAGPSGSVTGMDSEDPGPFVRV